MMSDLSLEIIGDFAIVWLLSPKKTFAAAPTSAIGKITSQLPGHALQVPLLSKSQCDALYLYPHLMHPIFNHNAPVVYLSFVNGSHPQPLVNAARQIDVSPSLKQGNPAVPT